MRAATPAVLAALTAGAAGHGYVVDPPPRAAHLIPGTTAGIAGSCASGICFWFSQSCTIGCPKCGGTNGPAGCGAQQGKATLPKEARTYFTNPFGCGKNPWCAPGSAPIMNPCGVAGGDVVPGKPGNGGNPPPGHVQGEDGRLLPELPTKTAWQAGSVVDISWAIIANHGGGYQYRLAPKSPNVTEADFQKTPMPFSGDEQYIEYCPSAQLYPPYGSGADGHTYPAPFRACDPTNRTAIPAVDVRTGTVPAGSTWRRDPIPACTGGSGGSFSESNPCGKTLGKSASDYQFPPPGPDLSRPGFLLGGFGAAGCYGIPGGCGQSDRGANPDGGSGTVLDHMFNFNIVDKVIVPQVPPGEYIMSFRWDCEQTPQIWSTCSDVTITA